MSRRRRVMPRQTPGRSRQNYCTPVELLDAVRARLGVKSFALDLAADSRNTVANRYYSRTNSALDPANSWAAPPRGKEPWAWCNPEFSMFHDFTGRAFRDLYKPGVRVAMLVRASVGANWWRDHVDLVARVWFLNGRITFKGQTDPYPQDCAILIYDRSSVRYPPGYEVWNWRAGGELRKK